MELVETRLHIGGLSARLLRLNNQCICALGDVARRLQLRMDYPGYQGEKGIERDFERCF